MIIIAYLMVLLCLVLASLLATFGVLGVWADFKGAPFVPTSGKIVKEILTEAKMKPGGLLIELGSGDGRVVRLAVRDFGMRGMGVDVNPMLVWYAKMRAKMQGLREARFRVGDMFSQDLGQASVVFMFLLPGTLKRLQPKLEKECRRGTLVISHGFKIVGWEDRLVGEIQRKVFPTYYYKV